MKVQTSSPQSLYIGAWFLSIAGLVLLCVAAFLTYRTSHFIENSETAQGSVIALEPVTSTDSNSDTAQTTYAPVFSFQAADGKTYAVRSNSSSSPPAFAVNDEVTVLYDPNNPQKARIDTFWQVWGVPVLLGAMGAFFFAIAGAFAVALRKLLGNAQPAAIPK